MYVFGKLLYNRLIGEVLSILFAGYRVSDMPIFGTWLGLKWANIARWANALSLLDRCQAGVFELWVPGCAAACGCGVEDRPQGVDDRGSARVLAGVGISPLISPLQKWRTVPSLRVKTVRPGTPPSSALTQARV
jgi:hypothetical protein